MTNNPASTPPASGGGHAADRLREQLARDLGEVPLDNPPDGPGSPPHDSDDDDRADEQESGPEPSDEDETAADDTSPGEPREDV